MKSDIIASIFVVTAWVMIASKIVWGFPIQIIGCTAWIHYGMQIRNRWLIATNVAFILTGIYGVVNWLGLL